MKGKVLIHAGWALLVATLALASAAEDPVQALAKKWTDAYNAHDRAALGALYTDNAHLMMHGDPTIKGRKNIEAFWAKDFKEGDPITKLTVTNSVNGVDMVLVHGNYEVIDRKTGKRLGYGRFAHIWDKDGKGAWRLDRDLWNQPVEAANK
jgi:uncharacterized protein (TIGR02246 family)